MNGMHDTGHGSEKIAVAIGVVKPLANAHRSVGQLERHAHQRQILRIRSRFELQVSQNRIEPRRPLREPAVDALDRIAGHDMAEEYAHGFRLPPVKERISPRQTRAPYAEDAPADKTPPFANGD